MELMNVNAPCTSLTLAAGVSDQVAIPEGLNYISVYNPSTEIAYIKTGESATMTCDATATFIPPKSQVSFERDSKHTYMAGFCALAVTLNIQNGGGV